MVLFSFLMKSFLALELTSLVCHCDLDITPDIVTYGKVIGGGLPVGAIAGNRNVMETLAPVGEVYQAGTLSANPLAMVGGLSTLKKLDESAYKQIDDNALKN